jgi:periplasmic protein TonB
MKSGLVLGIGCALALHAGFLLFGGIFFLHDEATHATLAKVELLSADEAAAEDDPEKEPEQPEPAEADEEALEAEAEEAPDAAELIRNLELSAVAGAPELEAASLSAIEAALSGQTGGSMDFAQALDFSSGGRIGGTGKAGALDETLEDAFSLAEIDQKPRVLFQAAPGYPVTMRGRKVEGVVSVLFVVNPDGKVDGPRVETSSHTAFEKPAVDAVKHWTFEPAVKSGKRVACKMRVSVRFPPS